MPCRFKFVTPEVRSADRGNNSERDCDTCRLRFTFGLWAQTAEKQKYMPETGGMRWHDMDAIRKWISAGLVMTMTFGQAMRGGKSKTVAPCDVIKAVWQGKGKELIFLL